MNALDLITKMTTAPVERHLELQRDWHIQGCQGIPTPGGDWLCLCDPVEAVNPPASPDCASCGCQRPKVNPFLAEDEGAPVVQLRPPRLEVIRPSIIETHYGAPEPPEAA